MRQPFLRHLRGVWARLHRRDACLQAACHGLRGAVLLGGAVVLMALAPRPGTTIPNIAQLTYQHATGGRQTIQSNVVTVIIVQEALTLTPDHNVSRPAGTQVVLPHRLTNTGNALTTYILRYANVSTDDYDFSDLQVIQDLNSNDKIDPGEPVMPPGGTVSLPAGASLDLLLSGLVPATTPPDKRGLMTITATSQIQGAMATNTDTVTTSDVVLKVLKSASTLTPQPRDKVTFTLLAQNTGSGAATGIPLTVDGRNTALVIIRDMIPAQTTFVRVERSDG